jgi:hypothetical protein
MSWRYFNDLTLPQCVVNLIAQKSRSKALKVQKIEFLIGSKTYLKEGSSDLRFTTYSIGNIYIKNYCKAGSIADLLAKSNLLFFTAVITGLCNCSS